MFIEEVQFQFFRNYRSLNLNPDPSLNLFLGDNGEGKTSFLEALYLSIYGKSFRPYVKREFISKGEKKAFLKMNIQKDGVQREITSRFSVQGDRLKKEVFESEKPLSFLKLRGKYPILVFTEEKLKSIKEGAEIRRHLLDEILLTQGKERVVRDFKKIFQEKKACLLSCKREEISKSSAIELLETLNVSFLKKSLDLIQARKEILSLLKPEMEEIAREIFSDSSIEIDFEYESFQGLVTDLRVFQGEFESRLKGGGREREISSGRVLYGPQRDEIHFIFNQNPARIFCSQGEARVIIFSLIASQIKTLKNPLLFLDDIFSELDEKKQKSLFRFIQKKESQTFLTCCKKPYLDVKKMSVFRVKNGTINEVK